MDVDETLLSALINPNNFPAKLWRLVNSPTSRAVRWDSSGGGVIIEQQLFEKQFLSPCNHTSENTCLFKTSNFTSFVRQLNLYGFRKEVVSSGNTNNVSRGTCYPTAENGTEHHFHNPNFKRNRPELLVNLKRLTTSNKAKLEAGMEVNSRPPSRYNRFFPGGDGDGREKIEKRGSSSFLGQTHQESTHPYHPNRTQHVKEYNRTPIPPRTLMMGHGAAPPPTIFTTDKGIPISVIHRYPGIGSGPTSMHIQQGLQGLANPGQKFSNFTPHHAQYQPGFYSPGSVASNMTGSGHQTDSLSHHGYYQPSCPVNILCHGNQNEDLQNDENQEMNKCDINLDTVFQIVDELEGPSKICLVKVVTPEKQLSVSEPSSTLPVSSQCDSFVYTVGDDPPAPCGPITAVNGRPVKGEQLEEPVGYPKMPLMPYKCPGKVSSDEAKDTEVLDVEVCSALEDDTLAQKSRSTRK
ncbi:heat shock factor protein 5 [Centroberyx gerrardi]|uniref:heat shock factor protein 5 n=1 Tax=Centroberyx gerrardi TaxID=166262 RepID=UPI003AAEFD7B